MARRRTILADERGAALFIAILAMLLLGVFTLSAVVMASLETRLGLNQKEAQQALALAAAGREQDAALIRRIADRPLPTWLSHETAVARDERVIGIPSAKGAL